MTSLQGERAVVIGGSIAGLQAARVLSAHFREVVILERDALLRGAAPRQGTPHARHTHGLLAGGLGELIWQFPGIDRELLARGAVSGDLVGDSTWFVEGAAHVEVASGLVGSMQSRPLLEQVVRDRVAAIPNVVTRDRVSVDRLLVDSTGHEVRGVQLTDRRTHTGENLTADLVVDAAGRASRTPSWLMELGFPAPAEDRIEIDLGYATQRFERRAGDFGGKVAVIVTQLPPNRRMGVAVAVENGEWSLTLGGMGSDVPPADEAGFREFARGLPSPRLAEFLASARPTSDILLYRYPASIRRRYERLRRFPGGLLVIGDALCSFNPIYGQGMTVAALEARHLDVCLNAGPRSLAQRFFAGASRLIDTPWLIAATADFRFEQVRGRRPWGTMAMNWYIARVHRAAHHDPVVAVAFHRVANLLDQPASLFHPAILARAAAALGGSLRPFTTHVRPLTLPQAMPGFCRRFV
jgi:flavin-dependent dehydrogenase